MLVAIDGCTGSRTAVSESILRDAAAMLDESRRRGKRLVAHGDPAQHCGDRAAAVMSTAVEHEELHAELGALTKAPGRVGEAARNVATLLHPHFVKEEEYALPLVGEYVQAQLTK